MARNVRTYSHFCTVARALERVGERWSLLIVRDLLTGPKRFTDLMVRLGGITPATLSQRLRALEESGVLAADRQAGRREVWYRLTDAGKELAPVVDGLAWWGWQHAWQPPAPEDTLHIEHLLRAITQLLDNTDRDTQPVVWHFRLVDDGDYIVSSDGTRWSFRAGDSGGEADITATTSTGAWRRFMDDPTLVHAEHLGTELEGSPEAIRRMLRLLTSFRDAASEPRTHDAPLAP